MHLSRTVARLATVLLVALVVALGDARASDPLAWLYFPQVSVGQLGPPTLISILSGAVGPVAAHDSLLFIASGSGLQILDSRTSPLEVLGNLGLPVAPRHIESLVAGPATLYVVAATDATLPSERRLLTVDVADPTRPRLVSSIYLGRSGGSVITAALGSDRLSISTSMELLIVDISRPHDPTVTYHPSAGAIAASGRSLYLLSSWPASVLDLTDPAVPRKVGEFSHANGIEKGVVVGDVLYTLSSVTSGPPFDMFCNDYSLEAYSLANPTLPTPAGAVTFPSDGTSCTTAPSIVAAGPTSIALRIQEGRLQIVDTSEPLHPMQAAAVNLQALWGALSGKRLYLSTGGELHAYDITDPRAVTTLPAYDPPLPATALSLLAAGPSHAVVGSNAGPDFVLELLDLSRPERPQSIGSIQGATGQPVGAVVEGDWLFVLEQQGTLHSIAGALGGPLRETGAVSTGTEGKGLAVAGSYAYVADYARGLVIVSLADPRVPIVVRALPLQGARQVAIQSGRLFVLAGLNPSVQITLDLTDPSAPVEIGRLRFDDGWMPFPLAGPTVYIGERVSCGFGAVCEQLRVAELRAGEPVTLSIVRLGAVALGTSPTVFRLGDGFVTYSSSRECVDVDMDCAQAGMLAVIDVRNPGAAHLEGPDYRPQLITAHTLHGRHVLALSDGDLLLYEIR